MRHLLIVPVVLIALSGHAHAQALASNPALFPSASLVTGNCIQATGSNSIASTGAPCGEGSGGGNVTGPTSSTIGNIAVWSNGTGTGLADSNIQAANIPQLGAAQTWGGLNTYSVRPVFNGATPWDTANFTPALYGSLAGNNHWTGSNTWSGIATFSSRPVFGTATPWDSANLDPTIYAALAGSNTFTGANAFSIRPTFNGAVPYDTGNLPAALAPYLTSANAASTYLKLVGGSLSGPLTAPALNLSAAAGTWKPISFNTGTGQRWQLGSDNDPETGSNSGSNFRLYSYADNGTVIANILNINRATGAVAWSSRPFFAGNLAWDAGNFNPANYCLVSGCNSTGTGSAAGSFTINPASNTSTLSLGIGATATPSFYDFIATGTGPGLGTVTFRDRFLNFKFWSCASSNGLCDFGADPTVEGVPLLRTDVAALAYGALSSNNTWTGANNFTTDPTGITLAVTDDSTHFATTAHVKGVLSTYLTIAQAAATYLTQASAGQTYATIAGVQSAYLRITDAANTYLSITNAASTYLSLTNAASTYLTQANAATTYLTQAVATSTYLTQSNAASTYLTKALAAATYLTPAQGDARYIQQSGAGTPYDIAINWQGVLESPTPKPMPTGYHILYYTFVRKVVIPVGFVGSAISPISPATGTVSLGITSTGTAGGIGNLTCGPGAAKCAFATVGGPFVFNPGDILSITTSSNTPDATLAGLSGVLLGAISQ